MCRDWNNAEPPRPTQATQKSIHGQENKPRMSPLS